MKRWRNVAMTVVLLTLMIAGFVSGTAYGKFYIHGRGVVDYIEGKHCHVVWFFGRGWETAGPAGYTCIHDMNMWIERMWLFIPLSNGRYFIGALLSRTTDIVSQPIVSNEKSNQLINSDSSVMPSVQPATHITINPAVTTNPIISNLFETISEQINSYNSNVETTPSTTPNAQPNPSTTPSEAMQTEPADIPNTVNEERETNNC